MRIVKAYLSELFLALKYLPLFRYLYREYGDGKNMSEEDKMLLHTAMKLPMRLMQGESAKVYRVFYDVGGFNFNANWLQNIEAIYVNGIMTPDTVAKYEAQLMSKLFEIPITLFYNNTNGFFSDVYDCIRMRIRNKSDEESKALRELIVSRYEKGLRHFFLIGYSQGSILTCRVMDNLPADIRETCRFTVLTFGAAQDELAFFPKGTARHVAHHRDYIARIGALHHAKKGNIYGEVLRASGDTHGIVSYVRTMQDHDIPTIIRGELQHANKK